MVVVIVILWGESPVCVLPCGVYLAAGGLVGWWVQGSEGTPLGPCHQRRGQRASGSLLYLETARVVHHS